MDTPLVSVIVPNYNHAPFLAKRFKSILEQTVMDLEVIVLDDCSTDNSREIITQFAAKDKRIRTFFNSSNSGSPFLQWEKGIGLAGGTFIWIAESDDFSDLDFLEKLLAAMENKPDAGLAYCQSNFVDSAGSVIGTHLDNLSSLDHRLWLDDFCMDGQEALARFMPVINIIPNAGAVVFKRSICKHVSWDAIAGFKLAGDRLFWSSLFLHTSFCFVAQPMNYFRMDGNTVRSRHMHTIGYLYEIVAVINWINKEIRVPLSTKHKAVRQWLHHLRKVWKETRGGTVSMLMESLPPFMGLLRIYLTK